MRLRVIIYTILILHLFQVEIISQENWQELKSQHFLIYFPEGLQDFVERVSSRAERDYLRISDYLGYGRTLNFWTWENRVKIYIYPDKSSYLQATSTPEWSIGVADYKKRAISSFVDCQDFLDSTLPHEIAHLMFRDFVGLSRRIPVWLDEGVAIFSEVKNWQEREKMIKENAEDGSVMPIKNLMSMDISLVKNPAGLYIRPAIGKKRQTVMFLTGESLVNLYYSQAASIVNFLIEIYGTKRFANFCRNLRDGKTVEEALQFSYPNSIGSIEELQEEWLRYLKEERP